MSGQEGKLACNNRLLRAMWSHLDWQGQSAYVVLPDFDGYASCAYLSIPDAQGHQDRKAPEQVLAFATASMDAKDGKVVVGDWAVVIVCDQPVHTVPASKTPWGGVRTHFDQVTAVVELFQCEVSNHAWNRRFDEEGSQPFDGRPHLPFPNGVWRTVTGGAESGPEGVEEGS